MALKEYHIGTVRRNDDPEKRGRLIVEAPTIVSGETLPWAEPSFHFVDSSAEAGSFWVPNPGSMVEIEIEGEVDSEFSGLMPKWRCNVYPLGTVPPEFQENYPERRGWKTRAGHILYFDDTDDARTFYYEHPSGTKIKVVENGNIELSPAPGQSVLVGEGADQKIARGDILDTFLDAMKLWADSHIHVVGTIMDSLSSPCTGATGVANPSPGVPSNLLSDDHKVK